MAPPAPAVVVSKSGAAVNCKLLPAISNAAPSAPGRMVKVASVALSTSVDVRVATAVLFSATSKAALLVITGAVSSTSSTLIVKVCVAVDPSMLVASMVMSCVSSVSKSSDAPATRRTSPVVPLIVKRPSASSVRVKLTAWLEKSSSDADASIPTSTFPVSASDTSSAAISSSAGVETSNSSTSLIIMVNVSAVLAAPFAGVANTVMSKLASVSRLRSAPAATETSPEEPSIWNRPPAVSLRL